MIHTVYEISSLINGEIVGDSSVKINGPAKIEEAAKGDICFYNNDKYSKYLETTEASAILVSSDEKIKYRPGISYILVGNVYQAIAKLLQIYSNDENINEGIHSTSIIDDTATIEDHVMVGPGSIISANSKIEAHSIIYGQVYIGQDVSIGKNVTIYPGVKIYRGTIIEEGCIIHANSVIGTDGFGFVPDNKGVFSKIPQVGIVKIERNVEIGSNCSIDRASMGMTIIREGVKLDNLIHIAHNVEIGAHTVMAAQVGVAGSTKLGHHCMVGGQVGIVGHLEIGDQTQIQAQSGMIKSVKKSNTKWYGYPAIEYNNYLRSFAGFKNLPDLISEVRSLKTKIKNLEERIQLDE